MHLTQLKDWYKRYEDFWPLWKEYKFNGLDEKQIRAIEIFRDNNFRMNTKTLEMFYVREDIVKGLVKPLVECLQDCYLEYKEWVCMKFSFQMAKKGFHYEHGDFFTTPIDLLVVDEEFRKNLKDFGCKTIDDILSTYGDAGLQIEVVFTKVKKFKALIENSTQKMAS